MPSDTYIDVYLLPVKRDRLEDYSEQAAAFGAVAREHGALSYRELVCDDTGEGMNAGDGLVMTTAIVEFTSREHRDAVMEKVMADPRVAGMSDGGGTAEMSRMLYGGFAPLVTA